MVVNKNVPPLVMIRTFGLKLPPTPLLPCKPLHGLGRGLDISLSTMSYVGFDARDGDNSRYRAERRKGAAVRDSSSPRVFLRKLWKNNKLVDFLPPQDERVLIIFPRDV